MNFMTSCLEPTIAVNKPERDGREITNLISRDPSLRKNGYMGEYFIRPPVDITVTFKVPIDISHIKLNTKLEQKCTTGFTIFTEPEEILSVKERLDSVDMKTNLQIGDDRTDSKYVLDTNTNTSTCGESSNTQQNKQSNFNEINFCVGKFFPEGDEHIFILKNHHYRHVIKVKMPDDKLDNNTAEESNQIYKGALRHTNRLALRCVKRIILRILRSAGSEAPVLQSLEVWGQPGISTVKSSRRDIINRWLRFVPLNDVVAIPRLYNSTAQDHSQGTPDANISIEKETIEIPEDFLDPLTFEIMIVPLLLPSGHSLDAETLDKYIANEAIWGRPASDPFTGVSFKRGQMPSPNVPLKARIDRFLLMNADHPQIRACGRTLTSSSSGYQNPVFKNHWQYPRGNVSKRILDSQDESPTIHEEQNTDAMIGDPGTKRASNGCDLSDGVTRNHTEKYKKTCIDQHQSKVITNSLASTSKKDTHEKTSGIKSHLLIPNPIRMRHSYQQPTVKKSSSSHHGLVHMIGSAISSTRQRKNDSSRSHHAKSTDKPKSLIQGDAKTTVVEALDMACNMSVLCNCGEMNNLYNLPCSHILCRTCLSVQQSNPQVRCALCDNSYSRSDVVKYHKKSIYSN